MKQPKDKIHKLIKAMSPAEKRYFKRHYASEQSNLTQLFDYINNMQEYDEEKVKQEFSDSKLSQNLKVYKVQLLNLLLKSLTSYYNKSNPKSIIRIGLEEVDILMEKQLYDHAYNRLKKVKQECHKYQEFSYLIEIGFLEFKLQYIKSDRIGMSQNPVFSEIQESLKNMEEQIRFTVLSAKVMDDRKRINAPEASANYTAYYQKIMEHQLMQTEASENGFRSTLSRNIILSNLYFFIKDQEKELLARKANVALFDQEPHFKSYLVFEYLAVLLNYSNLCLERKEYDIVENMVTQAKQFAGKNPIYERQLVYFFYAQVKTNFEKRQFLKNTEKGLEVEVLDLIDRYNINKERIALIIYYYFALSHLALENPKKVQGYVRLMQQCHSEPRVFFSETINLVELIHHYETKDDHTLANLVNSYQRKYKADKNHKKDAFYPALLKLFNQLAKQADGHSELGKNFIKNKEAYKEDKLYFLFHYLQLDIWLNALCQNKPYSQLIKKA